MASFLPVIVVTVLAGSAQAETPVPRGFRQTFRVEVSPGVERIQLVRGNPRLVVNIARITPGAPASLRAVLSNDEVSGPPPRLERTSSMCLRVHCVIGLNGDFADVTLEQPLGALVTGGQLLRSPSDTHHQLSITSEGKLLSGGLEWSGKLVPTDLRSLGLNGVNVSGIQDHVVLFTPAFGPTTETPPATSLVIRTVEPGGPLRLEQTALVELVSLHENAPDSPIPPDGGLLVGQGKGAAALADLWARIQAGTASNRALLRLESPARVVESVGGSPILVRDGKRWFADVDDNFTRGRHPRTVVGWNPAGETLLVTVDGRQSDESVGMTLAEATDFMLDLGATEAINLDGGGSTTFVVRGAVVNSPSDVAVRQGSEQTIRHVPEPGDKVIGHVERPVASGLMVVPSNSVSVPPVDPLAGPSLGLPQALALPARLGTDPGSVPGGGLPALVNKEASELSHVLLAGAVAANATVAAGLGAFVMKRRQAGKASKGSADGDSQPPRRRPDAPVLA